MVFIKNNKLIYFNVYIKLRGCKTLKPKASVEYVSPNSLEVKVKLPLLWRLLGKNPIDLLAQDFQEWIGEHIEGVGMVFYYGAEDPNKLDLWTEESLFEHQRPIAHIEPLSRDRAKIYINPYGEIGSKLSKEKYVPFSNN